ncbi:MAG: helix-turn-helix domain-containing protein [Imperialibacter sp.]
MDKKFRSSCPISSALDILGDKWTLLIIRDIMFGKKSTFKDFSSSGEKIASGILANRLAKLETLGILHKGKLPDNKKAVIYSLTQKGIELLPIIVDMILWSDNNLGDQVDEKMRELAKKIRLDKEGFINNYTGHLQALMAAS